MFTFNQSQEAAAEVEGMCLQGIDVSYTYFSMSCAASFGREVNRLLLSSF